MTPAPIVNLFRPCLGPFPFTLAFTSTLTSPLPLTLFMIHLLGGSGYVGQPGPPAETNLPLNPFPGA